MWEHEGCKRIFCLFFSVNTNILMSETICVYLFTTFIISLSVISDVD
jgi:hypothetical protein